MILLTSGNNLLTDGSAIYKYQQIATFKSSFYYRYYNMNLLSPKKYFKKSSVAPALTGDYILWFYQVSLMAT